MSTDNLKYQFLETSIDALEVSPEFKAMAKANGFETIGALLDGVEMKDFTNLPLSGYRLQKELLDLLDKRGLMDLIED